MVCAPSAPARWRNGSVEGTGELTTWDVQAVYRAVGYRSLPVPGLPFEDAAAVVPNYEGRVLDLEGRAMPGTYVSGWIKRGPVGLIGHTKGDAAETVGHVLAETAPTATSRDPKHVIDYLAERGVELVELDGWKRLDRHEIELGRPYGRARVKVADRAEMIRVSLH